MNDFQDWDGGAEEVKVIGILGGLRLSMTTHLHSKETENDLKHLKSIEDI